MIWNVLGYLFHLAMVGWVLFVLLVSLIYNTLHQLILLSALVEILLDGGVNLSVQVLDRVSKIRKEFTVIRDNENRSAAQSMKSNLPPDQLRPFESANERGASVWLSALPLKENGFDLHKGAFRDAICLRYGWRPPDLPSSCVCGKTYSIDHCLTSPHYDTMVCVISLLHY